MDSLAADIATMSGQLTSLIDKMDKMEKLLTATQSENTKLKDLVMNQSEEILVLKDRLNDREQYARSWSIRCLNIPLLKEQETDPRYVMQQVYSELLQPILKGAVEKGDIPVIPTCCELLEMAHILPAKGDRKPVIVRFYSRFMRSLVFRYRKDYAPRDQQAAGAHSGKDRARPTKMKYSFFEDLTKGTYKKLMEIKEEEEVQSAWTVSGIIRFKVKDSDTIYKVSSLSTSYTDIIKGA